PPLAITTFASAMPQGTAASAARNDASGPARVILTVMSSTTWMSFTGSMKKAGLSFRFFSRRSENRTSLAVMGLPEVNFTPGRSLNVYTVPSGDTVQDVARRGWILVKSGASTVTSVSYAAVSRICDVYSYVRWTSLVT